MWGASTVWFTDPMRAVAIGIGGPCSPAAATPMAVPGPMRGLKRQACERTIAGGHAFVQDSRRDHYAITDDAPVHDRVRVASFDELLYPSDCTDPPAKGRPAPSHYSNATAPNWLMRLAGCD